MESITARKRIDYVDIAKGIGMLLVMWAHILVEGPINWFIYIFHMPLFFFISGMLFIPSKYPTCLSLIKKRYHTLIVPYVCYSVITWIVWVAYSFISKSNVASYWMPLAQTVIAQGSGGFLVHNVPLWFVTCLFVVEVTYFYINKIDNVSLKTGLCLLLTVLGYCMIEAFEFFPFNLLPWSIEVALASMVFYSVGNTYGQNLTEFLDIIHQKKKLFRLILLFALLTVTVLCSLVTRHISFGSDRLGAHPVPLYLGAFAGIIMILLISNEVSLLNISLSIVVKFIDYIKWIGKNSFRFMAVHVPIKGFLTAVVARIFHTTTNAVGGNLFYCGIVFIITLLLTTMITMITNLTIRRIHRKG